MKCPVCITESLVMSERQGEEIDYCPTCRGVWLDRGELDKIIEKATSAEKEVYPFQIRHNTRIINTRKNTSITNTNVKTGSRNCLINQQECKRVLCVYYYKPVLILFI